MILHTSMAQIRANDPCSSGWRKLLVNTGRDEDCGKPLRYSEILASNGLDDCLWALTRAGDTQEAADALLRAFACACAYRALPLFERQYPNDTRPRVAIDTAWRFVQGRATAEQLASARDAAGAAWDAAGAARDAAWDAAGAAAWDAAGAARDAAWGAAGAAAGAARDAARAAAWDAEKTVQTKILHEMLIAVEAI